MKKSSSEYFQKAIEYLENLNNESQLSLPDGSRVGPYSCLALMYGAKAPPELVDAYAKCFSPEVPEVLPTQYRVLTCRDMRSIVEELDRAPFCSEYEKAVHPRIIALGFAAAMAETGDL